MTQGQSTQAAADGAILGRLSELENERAVDRIESAERNAPYCVCGSHMLAVVKGDSVWLECSRRQQPRAGISGLMGRLQSLVGHSSRRIMELPLSD